MSGSSNGATSTTKTSTKTSSQKFAEADAQYADRLASMTMSERSLVGLPYVATDDALMQRRLKVRSLFGRYNRSVPGPADETEVTGFNDIMNEERRGLLREMFGIDEAQSRKLFIDPPFFCDYGTNITFEGTFYCNFNTTILDCATVRIGDGVLFGPNVHLYSATHSVSITERETGAERALPIVIGQNTWVGGNVSILAGVTIGQGCTVGAGSVVTRDVPDWSVVAGNPARVLKTLSEAERGDPNFGPSKGVSFAHV